MSIPIIFSTGDGRNDSPGHSSQYLTYTVMSHDTKNIVAMSVVDKREVELKSPNMEKVGLNKSIRDCGEDVTDGHVQIKSLMSE